MKKSILITLVLMLTTSLFGETGYDIMKKADEVAEPKTSSSTATLTIHSKKGSDRLREVIMMSKDYGDVEKSVIVFTTPKDVAGTGYLMFDYDDDDKDSDNWLYLPAMKKTRRIASSGSESEGSFMGTDFTYDDMGQRHVDEDTHKLLREETRNGHKCWVVESVPVDKHEIYSRKVTWIRQDCLIADHVEYYDKLNKLHRVLDIQDVKKIQGFWTIQKMEMKNVQTEHSTTIVVKNSQYNVKVDKALFTVAKLEKGL